MADQYRHSIEELLTRYTLEPSLRDVYVEGEQDKRVIDWFLSDNRGRPVTYTINSVAVPDTLLTSFGMTRSGNGDRVHALALILCRKLPNNSECVFCIIDKDFGEMPAASLACRFLNVTDFSSMEGYALSNETLEKFFALYLGIQFDEWQFQQLLGIVSNVFFIKLANMILAPEESFVGSFWRCCSLSGGRPILNVDEYLRRVTNGARGIYSFNALVAKFQELENLKTSDVRNHINGHHLVAALSWYGRNVGVAGHLCHELPLRRALVASISNEELREYPLFQRLCSWAERAA